MHFPDKIIWLAGPSKPVAMTDMSSVNLPGQACSTHSKGRVYFQNNQPTAPMSLQTAGWLFTSTNTGDSSYQVNVLLKNEHYGLLQPGAGISNIAALSRRMSTESGVELLNSIPGSEMNSFCGQITSHPCLFPHRKSNTCLAMVVWGLIDTCTVLRTRKACCVEVWDLKPITYHHQFASFVQISKSISELPMCLMSIYGNC